MWNLSEQIPHITGRIYLGYGVYELVRAETTYTQGYLLPIKAFCSLVFFYQIFLFLTFFPIKNFLFYYSYITLLLKKYENCSYGSTYVLWNS